MYIVTNEKVANQFKEMMDTSSQGGYWWSSEPTTAANQVNRYWYLEYFGTGWKSFRRKSFTGTAQEWMQLHKGSDIVLIKVEYNYCFYSDSMQAVAWNTLNNGYYYYDDPKEYKDRNKKAASLSGPINNSKQFKQAYNSRAKYQNKYYRNRK